MRLIEFDQIFSSLSLDEWTAAVNRNATSLKRGVERAMEGRLWEQLIPYLAVNRTNDNRKQSTRE